MATKTEIKDKKAKLVKAFGKSGQDSGSTEVQVAIITKRIEELNGHFKSFVKDHASRRGLLALVGQRRRLLNYLKKSDSARYSKLIDSLGLRK